MTGNSHVLDAADKIARHAIEEFVKVFRLHMWLMTVIVWPTRKSFDRVNVAAREL